jgi:hypothetical protein
MLRCAASLRHCGVRKSTPHSSEFARLACGAFYEATQFPPSSAYLLTHREGNYAFAFMSRPFIIALILPHHTLKSK